MAIHSSILAWKIPWTEEPGGLQLELASQNWRRAHHEDHLKPPALAEHAKFGPLNHS